MQIVITVSAATHQDGGKAIKCALDAMGLAYAVEFLGDERSFGGNGSLITHTCRLEDLPSEERDASGIEYLKKQVGVDPLNAGGLQGSLTEYAINPLESAITTAAGIISDYPNSADRLTKHLDELLALQLYALGAHRSDVEKASAPNPDDISNINSIRMLKRTGR